MCQSKKWGLVLIISLAFQCLQANDSLETSDIDALIKSNPDEALIQVEQLWQQKAVKAEHISSGLLMIKAYIGAKQYPKARELLEQFKQLKDLADHQQAQLLAKEITLARLTKDQASLPLLLKQAEETIKGLTANPQHANAAMALTELNYVVANVFYFEGAFAEAQEYLENALKYIGTNRPLFRSDILNTLGVCKAQLADLAGAAEDMLTSIQVLEDNNLAINPSRYQNLGSLNFMLKNWDRTIEMSEKALKLHTQENANTAALYSNMAAAYIEKGELQTATEQLNQSIAVSERIGGNTASARNNLGYIYNQLGDYQKALEQLAISRDEFIKADRHEELSVSYKSMADVYANLGQTERASELYEKAYQLHQEHDFKMKRVELYPKWIEVLSQMGDFKKAYQLMVEYKALNDEIIDVESTEKVNELMTAYEVEKNKRALLDSELTREKQQQDIALLESKTAFDEKIQYLLILLLFGLFIILFLMVKSWRYRGQVNRVLIDKNQRIHKQHQKLTKLNTQLKTQSEIDTLTGLKNRRYITQMIVEESVRNKTSQNHWALIIIDIDDFKQINDEFGHQAGDEVLVRFSQCLQKTKGKKDVVARWGGEEFLWLARTKPDQRAKDHCDRLQSNLQKMRWINDSDTTLTCSMGFSSFPLINLCFEDWEAALKLADHALYHAKNSGKNQWFGFRLSDQNVAYKDIQDVDKLIDGQRLEILSKTEKPASENDSHLT